MAAEPTSMSKCRSLGDAGTVDRMSLRLMSKRSPTNRPRDRAAAASAVMARRARARPRRNPLRFMWQMDADGRFSLGSDEFTRLIGARTAAGFGRLWSEIAEAFGLDPDGRVAQGDRHPRYLERHHPELAGRWRRPVAGGIVGPAGLRSQRAILPAIAASAFAAISTA